MNVKKRKTMKQRETKSMLLLPCAVIAAVIGIMVYFACSDDEWEGSPEYLMTHAPMQTRAGVDVGGDIETFSINSGSETNTKPVVVNGMSMTVELSWPLGNPGTVQISRNMTVSDSITYNQYGDTLYHFISSSYVHNQVQDRTIYKDSSAPHGLRVVYATDVYVTYNKYHYSDIHEVSYIETVENHTLTFSVDASNYAEIITY